MLIEQVAKNNLGRCAERTPVAAYGKDLTPLEKNDSYLQTDILDAFWKDDILRALDYYQIDVQVRNGVVSLNGHITSSRSQNCITHALRKVSGIVEIKNRLVSDDKLLLDVAASLGILEHVYNCKFFTGATHGVISLNGTVKNQAVKLLAEKYASDNQSTRGIVNNIQVSGAKPASPGLPFFQPVIGEIVYFRDWASGIVKQVVINPANRRVIAMVVQGKFTAQQTETNLSVGGGLIVIPMNTVRFLTGTSVFLHVGSNEKSKYTGFNHQYFVDPLNGWVPPYPYCPNDVLFPLERGEVEGRIGYNPVLSTLTVALKSALLQEKFLPSSNLDG